MRLLSARKTIRIDVLDPLVPTPLAIKPRLEFEIEILLKTSFVSPVSVAYSRPR